jgi:hypothetical protein
MRRKGALSMEVMVQIAVPADLHTQVKMQAAAQRMTLKEFVLEALRKSVEKGGKK